MGRFGGQETEGLLADQGGSLEKLEDAASAGMFIDSAPRDCVGNPCCS